MRGGGEAGSGDLWAKAAELERQFEGYKRRLDERRAAAAVADRPEGDGGAEEEEDGVAVAVARGRRYEAYVRRRDEKLRQGWRARMERKEAEMKAQWARLGRRRDGELAAGPDEQKTGNLGMKPASLATPRCSSLPRTPRNSMASPAGAAASPRLSSNPDARRRPLHREPSQAEPPATPRKENRMPPPPSTAAAAAAAATTTPRLMALARSRSSLKDSDRSSTVRDSPRPLRLQSPRPSHDGAGDRPKQPVLAPTTAAVLAEIKTAAALRLRRSGNGVAPALPASPRPVITRQVDVRSRQPDIGNSSNAHNSTNSDIDSNNFSIDEGNSDDETAKFSAVKPDSFKITGDSDTEPSYVYIKKAWEEDAMNSSQAMVVGSGSDADEPEPEFEKETGDLQETAMVAAEATAKQSPVTDAEHVSRKSSDSFYSNVQSSFSHRSELAGSTTDSPLHSSPSSGAPSTEQLLEADAAMLRKKREEVDEEAALIKTMLIPSNPTSSTIVCSVAVQSPADAVAGLKRFLTFCKKNIKTSGGETAAAVAAAVEHETRGVALPACDGCISQGCTSGDSIKPRTCSSYAASDDQDNNIVISHVRSMQSCLPSSAKPILLKEVVSSAKSPRANRSFFSFSSFKSRGY